MTHLKKPDEVGEYQAVDVGQTLHDVDGRAFVLETVDAFLVEFGRYQRFVQLPVPVEESELVQITDHEPPDTLQIFHQMLRYIRIMWLFQKYG